MLMLILKQIMVNSRGLESKVQFRGRAGMIGGLLLTGI